MNFDLVADFFAEERFGDRRFPGHFVFAGLEFVFADDLIDFDLAVFVFDFHGRPEDDRGGPRAEMVRYFGGAAIAALLCGAMNVLETAGGGDTAAAIGNATNLAAVGLIWAGARRLNHRRAVGAVSTAAGAVLMLGFTFLIPLDDATLLKTAGLTVFGALSALELSRRPLGALSGARVLSWTLGAYAAWAADRYRLGGRTAALRQLRAEQRRGCLIGEGAGFPSARSFVANLDRFLRASPYYR